MLSMFFNFFNWSAATEREATGRKITPLFKGSLGKPEPPFFVYLGFITYIKPGDETLTEAMQKYANWLDEQLKAKTISQTINNEVG